MGIETCNIFHFLIGFYIILAEDHVNWLLNTVSQTLGPVLQLVQAAIVLLMPYVVPYFQPHPNEIKTTKWEI